MKIGLLGTGLMGEPMALRLQECGHGVVAYNRTPAKLQSLVAQGIETKATPAALLSECDCVILMVSDAAAIAATLLTPEAKSALAHRTVIQMGTIAPDESRAFLVQVEGAGGTYLEAPVLGSIPQVKTGSLMVMVGSTPDQFQQWQPVLQCLGEPVMHLGPVGAGAAVKLAMNQLIGSLTTAFALSLALVQCEHIDVEAFMQIVRGSALYAPTFDKKLERMLNRNFDNPNFPTKHLLKDMNLFSQAATAAGLSPELAKSVATVAEHAIAQGLADQDYSALYAAVNPETGQ
ncbi:MAG: NAD(P)-dependent oxidoreductase [Leptolyngbya sp. SIO1E4]|nr:NAD(P)-dependent oxidoreductase [Leptolyngbya sp. SIO1E4]